MNTEDNFNRIISEIQVEQRLRDNAYALHGALMFCNGHLQEENWASEEARLESLDMALCLCRVVLRRCIGEES
jgi:hypothetical protein